MSRHSRVAWKDGMVLLPQHFQQAERAADASLSLRLEALGHPGWGVLQLAFREDSLAQGSLELTRCGAILPDGTSISIPDIDAPPPIRRLELPADKAGVEVFLTLPLVRLRHPQLTSSPDRADIRAQERAVEVGDDVDPLRLRTLKIAARNLRLVLGGEPLDDLAVLRLGFIERSSSGELAFRTDVVPPLLRLSAHAGLEARVRALQARITARARSLMAQRAQRLGSDNSGSLLDNGPQDTLSFLFCQTLQEHGQALRQLLEQPSTHPFWIYQALIRLAGALSVFEPKSGDELPLYQHGHPAECFAAVDRQISGLLGRLFLSTFETIELTRRENWWHALIGDSELRARGRFLLGVSSTVAARELVGRFPSACKLADVDTLKTLVGQAVGGSALTWIHRPPPGLPGSPDLTWFQLNMEGPELERVRAGAPLGIYVPTWLPVQRLELWGYLPTQG